MQRLSLKEFPLRLRQFLKEEELTELLDINLTDSKQELESEQNLFPIFKSGRLGLGKLAL